MAARRWIAAALALCLGTACGGASAAGNERKALHYLATAEFELAKAFTKGHLLVAALDAANRSVEIARNARSYRMYGFALRARGDVFAAIGDEARARQDFQDAAEGLKQFPDETAWTELREALFVLDLPDNPEAQAHEAIRMLREALRHSDSLGPASRLLVVNAAHLNLAFAHRILGEPRDARRELSLVDSDSQSSVKGRMVALLIDAAEGDHQAAVTALLELEDDLDDDSLAQTHLALALLAVDAGPLGDIVAEQHLRRAIGVIEGIRGKTGDPGMRPWVLASRRGAYEALFTLLARHGRVNEAIAVAESLHARSFLDAILAIDGRTAPRDDVAERSRVDPLAKVAPSIGAGEVAQLLAGRELLMFVEAQGSVWRIHSRNGVAEITRLSALDLAGLRRWSAKPDDAAAAAAIGAALIPDALVDGDQPLYIIANGDLDVVPFPGLRSGGRFLIERRPLVRLPGLAALRCRPRPAATAPPMFLADAGGDLPGARTEAQDQSKHLSGVALLGGEATVAALSRASSPSLLHVSTHGGIGPSGGHMKLADGTFDAADVLRWGLAPAVVVLAGCATAASQEREGWGALPSAFLANGSGTVIATVRTVDDAPAATLISAFYAHRGAVDPVVALAIAQRERISARALPSHWSFFAAWDSPCSGE